MNFILDFLKLAIFPGGLFVLVGGLVYEWVDRKLVAQLQNRVGPRWFQPFADVIKLLAKEEVVPEGPPPQLMVVRDGSGGRVKIRVEPEDNRPFLFVFLPVLALAAALTAVISVPMAGLAPMASYQGDIVVTIYLLSAVTMSLALAGANTYDRFSLMGATRTLTQLFSYEAPFLLALLGPAIIARSWQITKIAEYGQTHGWFILTQPIGFIIALIGLMGKVEMPPFDAPEAETEIVAGALTEYSGRGWALFRLAKGAELMVGLTLIATLYLGGMAPAAWPALGPLVFLAKTLVLLIIVAGLQTLITRFRIDQTARYWRYGSLVLLLQMIVLVVLQAMGVKL
jgi:NADH-quinone oxidoreductase subunit H